MAWSIVGVGAVAETTSTTLTLTEPAGVANGDLLIACISSRTTATTGITSPNWALAGQRNTNNVLTTTSAAASACMLYRVRSGTPSLSFTLPAGISVAMGRIIAYRTDTGTPAFDLSNFGQTAINTTAVSLTGVSTTVTNELIVSMMAGGQEATWSNFRATSPATGSGATDTTTAPSTTAWFERADSVTTTGAQTSLGIFDAVKATVGSTGSNLTTASLGAVQTLVISAFKAVVAGTADAWNSNDKSATVTLSVVDKKAATTSASASGVRSSTLRFNGDAGAYYAEFRLDNVIGGTAPQVGLRSTGGLPSTSATPYSSVFVVGNNGNILLNGGATGSSIGAVAFANGDILCVAWNTGTERVWFRLNGGIWNNDASADPATGTNGLDASALEGLHFGLWFAATASTTAVTIRTELAEYTQALPSGFTSWMGETPPTADAWNVNDKTADVTLSISDKKATATASSNAAARSTQKYTKGAAGKYYAEFVNNFASTSLNYGVSPVVDNILVSNNGFYLQGNGGIRLKGSTTGLSIASTTINDVICLAWDTGAQLFWFRKNGGSWNNSATADPATTTEGIDASTLAAGDFALWVNFVFVSGGAATIRTELAEYTQAVPSGFTSWMGETPPGVTASVTGNSVSVSVGTVTVATVQSLPTLVGAYQGGLGSATAAANWAQELDAATRTTASFNVEAGDLLLVMAASEDDAFTFAAAGPSGGSLSYSLLENPTPGDSFPRVMAWSAAVDSAKSMTVALVNDGGTVSRAWGFIVYHFHASTALAVGAAESGGAASTAPSLGITTTADNSAIVYISADWNAVDGASRTWRTINSITPTSGNGLEKNYYRDGSRYTTYSAYWNDAGTSGAKTAGLSAPSGQNAAYIAIEVKLAGGGITASVTGNSVTTSVGDVTVAAKANVSTTGLQSAVSIGSVTFPSPPDAWNSETALGAAIFTNGDKTISNNSLSFAEAISVTRHSSGQFYAEVTIETVIDNYCYVAFVEGDYASVKYFNNDGTTTGGYVFPPWVDGDVIGIAADLDAGKLWFRVNGGSWNNNASYGPTTGSGAIALSAGDHAINVYFEDSVGVQGIATLDTTAPFVTTKPSGFDDWYEFALSGSVTATVTGVGITAAISDTTVSSVQNVSTTLTGQQITAAVGTASASGQVGVSTILSGLEIAVATGSVTATGKATAAPSGLAVTSAVGTPTATAGTGVSTTLTTNLATVSVGTAIASVRTSQTVTGQAAAVSVGTVTATGKAVASATGHTVATSVGDVTVVARVVATVSVTGQAVAVSVGTASVSAIQNVSVPVTGEQLSIGATGVSVSAGGSVATGVTSQAIAVAAGDVIVRHNARTDVTGQTTAVSVGTVTATGKASASVGGLEVTAAVGTASATGKAVVQVSGQQVTATLGNASVTAGGSVVVGVTGLEITASMGSPTVVAYGNETLPPAYRSGDGSTYAGGRTTTLVSRPSGVIAGDLLVAIVFCGRSGSLPSDPTPPAGWTQIEAASAINDGSFYGKSTLWWHRAGGSEPASYTWSHAETVSTQAAIAAYSGCLASGDPVDAASLNYANTGFAMASGITTTVTNTTLVYAGNNWSGSGTLDAPLGMTERFDSLVYLADQDWETASATDNRHQSLAGFNPWTAFLIALKPQPLPYGHTVARVTGKSVTIRVGKIVPQHSGIAYPGEIPPGLSVPPPTAGTSGTLTPYTGPMVITADGTLIANHDIDGMLTIQADNVTVSNCRLTSGDFWGIWCDTHDDISYDGLTVDHCTIIGTGEGQAAVLTGSNWTVTNCDISSWDNGIMVQDQGGLAEGNYIHDLGTIEGGHVDGIQLAGLQQGVVIRGNWVEAFHTSCVFIKSDYGPIDDVVVEFNTLINKPGERTAYPVYSYDDGGGAITNILIRSNRMEEGAGGYVRVQNSTPIISGNVDFYTDELIIDNTTVLPPVLIPMVGSAVEVGTVTVAVAGAVAVDVTGFELAVSVGSVTVTTGAEIPITPPGGMPWYGRPSGIPKKELKKAVRELLKRQEKRKKRRKPREIAREIIAAIEPQGLGVAEKRIVIRLISQALLSELPQMFYSEPLIHDKGEIERAILFIIEAAMQRILDEEEDEEAALLLLSAA